MRAGFVVRVIGYSSFQERAEMVNREVSRVQMVVDSTSYIDYGLLSGLAAKSELRELLDELYENLS